MAALTIRRGRLALQFGAARRAGDQAEERVLRLAPAERYEISSGVPACSDGALPLFFFFKADGGLTVGSTAPATSARKCSRRHCGVDVLNSGWPLSSLPASVLICASGMPSKIRLNGSAPIALRMPWIDFNSMFLALTCLMTSARTAFVASATMSGKVF